MRKVRFPLVVVALFATLALSSWLSACSPAPAAPPASSGATVKTTPHPEVKVNIFAGQFSSLSYNAGFALGDMINKKHPWLRVAVQETTQGADSMKSVASDPALAKNSMFSVASSSHYNAVNGTGPFEGMPVKYQVLFMYSSNAVAFTALDPKIQTMKDLDGKRLTVGGAGGASQTFEALIAAAGIKPSKTERVAWGPGKEALIDGKADGAAQTLGDVGLTPYQPPAAVAELQSQNGFHLIPMDAAVIKKASESALMTSVELQPGILGITKPTLVALNTNTYGVMPDFDPEIAYEVTKFVVENASGFAEYDKALASATKDSLAAISVPQMVLHPSAEKYYKEAGIKIGR